MFLSFQFFHLVQVCEILQVVMATENLKFSGPRGTRGRKAIFNGFQYTVHIPSRSGVWGRWWCARRKECSAAIRINHEENEVRGNPIHQHLPDHGAAKAAVARYALLDRARREVNGSTATLTQETLVGADSETRMQLPRKHPWNVLCNALGQRLFHVHQQPWLIFGGYLSLFVG